MCNTYLFRHNIYNSGFRNVVLYFISLIQLSFYKAFITILWVEYPINY